MKVKLKIMGPAKIKTAENPAEVELAVNSRVIDLMLAAGYTEVEAKYLVYVRNEEILKLSSPLAEGDLVKAVLQMGGG
jgi:hypothetical protein